MATAVERHVLRTVMSEQTKELLRKRRKQRQARTIRAMGEADVLVAADFLYEDGHMPPAEGSPPAAKRWLLGRRSLGDGPHCVLAPPLRPGQLRWADSADETFFVNMPDDHLPDEHPDLEGWRRRNFELAYLRFAGAGFAEALTRFLYHRYAFVPAHPKADPKKQPLWSCRGIVARRVCLFERAALLAFFDFLGVQLDKRAYHLGSPCFLWPAHGSLAQEHTTVWASPPCRPGGEHEQLLSLTILPWKPLE